MGAVSVPGSAVCRCAGERVQQKVNQAGQQLKQTQQDVKAVAKDPLKAAATAVINQG